MLPSLALGWSLALGVSVATGCGDSGGGATFGGSGAASATSGSGGSASGGKGGGTGGRGGSSSGSAGQSGSDAGPACPKLVPCGGDVAGEWTAREACLVDLDPRPEPGCEGATSYSADVSGSYAFDAQSSTLVTSISITAITTLDVNDACARSIATGARTAAEACPYLEAQKQADPAYESATCQLLDSVCHCVLTASPVRQAVANSYDLMGSRIIDTNGDAVDYCVDADELGVYSEAGDFGLTLWFDRK